MILRRFLIALLVMLMASGPCFAAGNQPGRRGSTTVKRERQQAQRQVAHTQQQIAANKALTRQRLNDLNLIGAEIEAKNREIGRLQKEVAEITRQIDATADSIDLLNRQIQTLRASAAASLRQARTMRQSMSPLAMIFSARSFTQAMKRAGYLKELDRSRSMKVQSLSEAIALLDQKKARLESLKISQQRAMTALATQRQALASSQQQMQTLVAELKKQSTQLNRELSERRRRAAELERELERVIAEEERLAREEEERRRLAEENARRAAQQPQPGAEPAPSAPAASSASLATSDLGKSFLAAKGKLPSPVAGQCKVVGRFGRTTHASLSRVEVENAGIDIETAAGAQARAVHPGMVSSIFYMDGYHNIVMVRHGEYLTVYANIVNLSVRKGDKVTVGQALGQIFADPEDNQRTILHFEVRKEREKLDPQQWLAH